MLKTAPSKNTKLPFWMHQRRMQRVAIAIVTAVVSFCLGELFSSQAQKSGWAQLPTSTMTYAYTTFLCACVLCKHSARQRTHGLHSLPSVSPALVSMLQPSRRDGAPHADSFDIGDGAAGRAYQ